MQSLQTIRKLPALDDQVVRRGAILPDGAVVLRDGSHVVLRSGETVVAGQR